ncbi:MAG TPA: sigma factor G inhibitor Gin [Pseudogracilibacillus sp.]|nr:sigma factor G inhibitor Gin [Pseudogracilibacillus sp.]
MDTLQRCIICEEYKEDGIHLYTTFICEACEHNMVHTDAREAKYNYYIEKLKGLQETSLQTSK